VKSGPEFFIRSLQVRVSTRQRN